MDFIFSKDWFSHSRNIVGIMTGTSADGVDLVLAKFIGSKSKKFLFSILGFKSFPFPNDMKDLIERAINNETNTREIAMLNFELAYFFSEIVRKFLKIIEFQLGQVDAIAVHGQTVWHEPKSKSTTGKGFTLQLVSLPALAQILKVPVVGDFRSKDVAIGGEGAPLVPIFDYEFLSSNEYDVISLNIGGIANITYLPKKCKVKDVVAFDTGPGNTWIDGAMKILFGKNCDFAGETASKGTINSKLFKKLKSINYVWLKPPKSTGREEFSIEKLNEILEYSKKNSISNIDVITTLTHFTAWSISENIIKFTNPRSHIVVSGGGAKNAFLVDLLSQYLPESKVELVDDYGIPSQVKEPLAFAFLGYLRLGGLPSNIPSVTGARDKISLGIVAF